MNNNLQATGFIDSDTDEVIRFAQQTIGQTTDQKEQAIKLYYAVRDEFRYDPYKIQFTPNGLKASAVIKQGYGYCVSKAVLLAAAGRAVGIPTRLGFADVKNHLSSEKLKQVMQSDVFSWHGYTEFYLNNKWVKATPAFNKLLCDKTGIKPLEFDGENDSIFHEFDQAGNKHMEYLKDHGRFDDLPFQKIAEAYKKQYPMFAKLLEQQAELNIEGQFDEEASSN
jgi:transglutaminase-like putative cysteine protease